MAVTSTRAGQRRLKVLRRMVEILVVLLTLAYLGLVVLGLISDRFIFPAPPSTYQDDELATALARETPPGRLVRFGSGPYELAGFHLPNPEARYTLLFSHGNGEDLRGALALATNYREAGYAVFAYDYRGYGTSTGLPSEAGVYADVLAAWDHLTGVLGAPPESIVSMGRSLGTTAAIELAVRRPVAGLVLEAPLLTAFRTVIPFRVLPWDKFPNAAKMKQVRPPVLVIHGREDRIIPFWHGQRIFALAPEPKRFVALGAHHMDALVVARDRYLEALRNFAALLDRVRSERDRCPDGCGEPPSGQ